MTDPEIAWAAGLFVGEGSAIIMTSKKPQGGYDYLCLQIGMYDERSIARFAKIFGVNYHTFTLKHRSHLFHRVMVRARTAERLIAQIWPYIRDTDKGDQVMKCALELGVGDWIIGEKTGVRPQRMNKHRGKK